MRAINNEGPESDISACSSPSECTLLIGTAEKALGHPNIDIWLNTADIDAKLKQGITRPRPYHH